MAGFQELLQLIANGEPVSAGVTNRPLSELDGNVRYLRDLLALFEAGTAIYARGVTVETDALVGMAVWFNPNMLQFERALATVETDPNTGVLLTGRQAQVWGVVSSKENSTKADLLLSGYAVLSLTQAIDGDLAAGRYYLSGSDPGKLVLAQPPVSVPILLADGQGKVVVQLRPSEVLEDHKHYRYALRCVPAGGHSPPAPGDRHEVTAADITIEGWLPANDPSFEGLAPPGAAFGYNLPASPLNNVWPPVPLSGATVEWNKGLDSDIGGTSVLQGPQGLLILDTNGIWWMSDCYGDVPWPIHYDTGDPPNSLSSLDECPRELYMELVLWFTRLTFQTSNTVVTSLRAAEGSHLSVLCLETSQPATTGNLVLNLNLDLVEGAADSPGYLVFKTLDGNTFLRGPVVEGLIAGSDNVTLSATAGSGSLKQGAITLSVDTDASGKELPIQLVRLDGVTEERYQDVLALGFPAARNSSYRGRLRIPSQLPGPMVMRLRLWLMGRAAGSLPALTLTYRLIPRPAAGLTTPLILPISDTTLAIATVVTLPMANEYVEVLSDPFTVAPGDVVLFTLGRSSGDAYVAEVHVLDQVGVLASL